METQFLRSVQPGKYYRSDVLMEARYRFQDSHERSDLCARVECVSWYVQMLALSQIKERVSILEQVFLKHSMNFSRRHEFDSYAIVNSVICSFVNTHMQLYEFNLTQVVRGKTTVSSWHKVHYEK